MATAVFAPPGLTRKGLSMFHSASSDLVEKLMLSSLLMPVGRAGDVVFFTQGVSNLSVTLREEGLGFSFLLVHLQGYNTIPANSQEKSLHASAHRIWW